MLKITRIAYNSSGWIRPTGDAKKDEAAGSYNSDYGFGHEEWLFRSEWQIDGGRYAFLQGGQQEPGATDQGATSFRCDALHHRTG
jgi:hypothetical protein